MFPIDSLPLLIALTLPQAPAIEDQPEAVQTLDPPAVETITAQELAGHIQFLSSDLMKGRDTATPEIRIAADYLATRLAMSGAEPAGDVVDGEPTYFAGFPLAVTTPKAEGTSLELVIERDGETLQLPCELNTHFVFFPRGLADTEIEAPVVFVGSSDTEEDEDPAARFEDLEVEDAIVLLLDDVASEESRRGFPGRGALVQEARDRGALGVIVAQAFDQEEPRPYTVRYRFMARFFDRASMRLETAEPPDGFPTLFLENPIRDQLDERLGLSEDPDEPRPLEGVTARFTFEVETREVTGQNVIGLIPGSDEELRREVVIYSAHYDHVGVGSDGQIYNGADDNASGTGALLEVAEAFAEGPRPKRSVAFLWVSGEEKGLLGSRWWSEHMTLPEGFEIVANINADMISRNAPHEVSLTPSERHRDYSTLVTEAVAACEAEGITPVFDADQFYGRTDSYNFARLGIPVIFFFAGVHDDYHQPGDDFEKTDVEKAARIARTIYRLGWAIAQAEEPPSKIDDRAGD